MLERSKIKQIDNELREIIMSHIVLKETLNIEINMFSYTIFLKLFTYPDKHNNYPPNINIL